MTRPLQKRRERFFTEQAIRSLGTDWIVLEECESPDFIIAEGDRGQPLVGSLHILFSRVKNEQFQE